MKRKSTLPPVIAVLLLSAIFCGCVSDGDGNGDGGGDGVTWSRPTDVQVITVMVNEELTIFNITLSLSDAADHVTEWDVQLRLIAVDSLGFEMLNTTFEIKAKDFTTVTVDRTVNTWYNMSVPFVLFKRSNDKELGLFEGRHMTFYGWITYDGKTYKGDPTGYILNEAIIPDMLLVPNERPTAAIAARVIKAYVGETLEFNATGSTDDAGADDLVVDWDWGDGARTKGRRVDEVMYHKYVLAGTFNVTVTVTDEEDANSTASLDVTIEELIRVIVDRDGIINVMGDHYLDHYVAFNLVNVGPFPFDLTNFMPNLTNSTGFVVVNNGSNVQLPKYLDIATTLSVVFYFNSPELFRPICVVVYERSYLL